MACLPARALYGAGRTAGRLGGIDRWGLVEAELDLWGSASGRTERDEGGGRRRAARVAVRIEAHAIIRHFELGRAP